MCDAFSMKGSLTKRLTVARLPQPNSLLLLYWLLLLLETSSVSFRGDFDTRTRSQRERSGDLFQISGWIIRWLPRQVPALVLQIQFESLGSLLPQRKQLVKITDSCNQSGSVLRDLYNTSTLSDRERRGTGRL